MRPSVRLTLRGTSKKGAGTRASLWRSLSEDGSKAGSGASQKALMTPAGWTEVSIGIRRQAKTDHQ